MECICRLKFIKNKKTGQMKHAYNKDNQNVTFHELKSTLKIGYNWSHIC